MSTPLLHPSPQSLNSPTSRDPGVQWFQEAVPEKKEEKRTLETFLKKPTPPPTTSKPKFTYQQGSGSPMVPRSRPIKKKEKNVRNVLREAHPLIQVQFHLPFQFPLPISRDPESKKVFLQKRKKRTLVMFFLKKFSHLT